MAGETRAILVRALQRVGRQADDFSEVDVLDPATPPELARWGSPTILVAGSDITGNSSGDAPGCRIYGTPDGVPRLEDVVQALLDATSQ